MRFFYFHLLLLLFLAACGEAPEVDAPVAETPAPAEAAPSSTRFVVHIEGLRLRDVPGPSGGVLRELSAGTELYDLGEVSAFTTPLILRGIPFNEPWLRVRTADGQEGWVYGGALSFEWRETEALPTLLMEKRLQTLFGPAHAERIRAYRRDFQQIKSADDFARAFRAAMALRGELVQKLEQHVDVHPGGEPPDLFWLEEALPAFVPQLVAEGTAYYLFADYRRWRQVAGQTPEGDDDGLVDLYLNAFPEDTIEYFFPAWTIQTWDYGGHSLLGRGIHQRLLARIDRDMARSPRFKPELLRLKDDLINDITRAGVTYWERPERIVSELEAIRGASLSCLDREDRIALEARLAQFADPAAAGIAVNQQAGE